MESPRPKKLRIVFAYDEFLPDAVDVLPYDASPDEDVVEEEEVLLSPPSPSSFHQQTFGQQAPFISDYCHPRSTKDVLRKRSLIDVESRSGNRSNVPVSW